METIKMEFQGYSKKHCLIFYKVKEKYYIKFDNLKRVLNIPKSSVCFRFGPNLNRNNLIQLDIIMNKLKEYQTAEEWKFKKFIESTTLTYNKDIHYLGILDNLNINKKIKGMLK